MAALRDDVRPFSAAELAKLSGDELIRMRQLSSRRYAALDPEQRRRLSANLALLLICVSDEKYRAVADSCPWASNETAATMPGWHSTSAGYSWMRLAGALKSVLMFGAICAHPAGAMELKYYTVAKSSFSSVLVPVQISDRTYAKGLRVPYKMAEFSDRASGFNLETQLYAAGYLLNSSDERPLNINGEAVGHQNMPAHFNVLSGGSPLVETQDRRAEKVNLTVSREVSEFDRVNNDFRPMSSDKLVATKASLGESGAPKSNGRGSKNGIESCDKHSEMHSGSVTARCQKVSPR